MHFKIFKKIIRPIIIFLTLSLIFVILLFQIYFTSLPRAYNPPCESYHQLHNITYSQLSTYPPVKIFIGIFTTIETFERRHLLRKLYRYEINTRQFNKYIENEQKDLIDYKFILGKPNELITKEIKLKFKIESEAFQDIIILDDDENLNDGKTYYYFKWVAENLIKKVGENNTLKEYDYIVKTDDDSFINLKNLALNLRPFSQYTTSLYYGYMRTTSPDNSLKMYATGMIEVLSTKYAEKVGNLTISKEDLINHPEDVWLAWILMVNGMNEHWIGEQCLIYDDPRMIRYEPSKGSLIFPQTITIHNLKEDWRWNEVIEYFYGDY
ncbi:glycosyltransferase family 31 protein [Gigaspora margarita]|uniref:Hexosyltransferase n=2 Tax=Gigaspora margarita TaxID=4874 RepID=A0A8H4EVR4_GIGMA|nr:glycosyltransferase family 31 protein [Gigaspora margarita]